VMRCDKRRLTQHEGVRGESKVLPCMSLHWKASHVDRGHNDDDDSNSVQSSERESGTSKCCFLTSKYHDFVQYK